MAAGARAARRRAGSTGRAGPDSPKNSGSKAGRRATPQLQTYLWPSEATGWLAIAAAACRSQNESSRKANFAAALKQAVRRSKTINIRAGRRGLGFSRV